MNRFAISALAVCAASSLTFANESEEWLTLDKEIENLGTALPQGGSGFAVSGFIKTAYWNSSDPFAGGVDVSGFSLDNARVILNSSPGASGAKISIIVKPADKSFSNSTRRGTGMDASFFRFHFLT